MLQLTRDNLERLKVSNNLASDAESMQVLPVDDRRDSVVNLLVGSTNFMGTDDLHFGNIKNFISVEELENVVKLTSIEPRSIHLKNLLVPLEEVFGSADF